MEEIVCGLVARASASLANASCRVSVMRFLERAMRNLRFPTRKTGQPAKHPQPDGWEYLSMSPLRVKSETHGYRRKRYPTPDQPQKLLTASRFCWGREHRRHP